MSNPAAWHPDPTGRHEHRYWDGEAWTDHVADAGQSSTDPVDGSGAAGVADASSGAPGPSDPGGADTGTGATAASPGAAPIGASPPGGTPTGSSAPGGAPGGGFPPAGGSAGGSTFPAAAPSAGQPAGGSGSNGLAVAALIIGILSLLIAIFPFVGLLGTLGGIAAVILGIVGRKKIARGQASGGGMAMTGIITGVLAIVLSLVVTVGAALFFQRVGDGFLDEFNTLEQCIEETGDEDECTRQFEEDLFGRFSS